MEENNLETLGGLCSHMLSSPMPVSDDVRECLTQLCVRPTCAAYIVFGMIQKAAKGDTSAAKFVKEMNGEGPAEEEIDEKINLSTYSDVVLYRLAKITLEAMQHAEQ